ncbi:MAG: hypothetical protein JJD93_09875, partial [Ilumatobacteraceae bacterium]|nr:hypothetical protein [Ilumatobacteraceae bacterium]
MTTNDPYADPYADNDNVAQPSTWTREHNHDVITRFAEKAPFHLIADSGANQHALLLQVICKELQDLSNEVVELQTAADRARVSRL